RTAGPHPDRQLALAESWLRDHPDDAGLLLCLGRLALMNRLWGKAREYFQAALARVPDAQTYAELARLLAHLGEHEASSRYYERGLALCAPRLPDLPLPPLSGRRV